MLDPAAAAFINHLLRSASWARDALGRHAGKTARFEVFPLAVAFTVLDSGEVAPAGADTAPAATVKFAPGLMLRLAARDESAWREIDIAGDTDFASAIHHVTRNLRWDVEEDLSRAFGDIAAHRMAETGRTLRRWGEQAMENTGRAFAEYWTEEQPLIAGARDLQEFGRAVDQLRDAAARLEKRIERLSSRR
ncbi:MAG: ubiquinone biosynthesis accessory factor UbiJ [Burkholderiales bacterium]